ncbi:MAG: hypothetical protein ACD_5C00120G0003, partial [uncultured bacterium]
EKIEKLILSSELQGKMSLESRKLAEALSWGNVASQYFDLYKKISNK